MLYDNITECVAGSESITLFIRSPLFLSRAVSEIIWSCVYITRIYEQSEKKKKQGKWEYKNLFRFWLSLMFKIITLDLTRVV